MCVCRGKWVIGLLAVFALFSPFSLFALGEEEERVRAYFADVPIMANIAACESKFTQYGESGSALHGGYGGRMVGIFQIYSDIHADYASGLGMDIYTTEGNLAYARHLYEREGTRPWNSSGTCWRDMPLESAAATSAHDLQTSVAVSPSVVNENAVLLTQTLAVGAEHEEVRILQRLLNSSGYSLADVGPGSPGSETTRFGALTRSALQKFQCAKDIVCSGDEQSTGYGLLGPRTRIALLGAQSLAVHSTQNAVTEPASPMQETSEIERLQAQIAELTRTLAALRAAR